MTANKYQFAIKHDVLKSGKEILTPVVRYKNRFFKGMWYRIVKVYDRYVMMDIDFIPNLTREECQEHIEGFKKEQLLLEQHKIEQTNFIGLEEF